MYLTVKLPQHNQYYQFILKIHKHSSTIILSSLISIIIIIYYTLLLLLQKKYSTWSDSIFSEKP